MTSKTDIEWSDVTWNPATGCTRISAGCRHCYAERLAIRLHAMKNPRYANGFELTLHRDKIRDPARWRKPRRIFVNSMSDLLHEGIPDGFIMEVFATMVERAPQHQYLVLSKRAERWPLISRQVMERWGSWPAHVLPAVSIESRRWLSRLPHLARVGGGDTCRAVSFEPLLGSLLGEGGPSGVGELAQRLREAGVSWAVSGGESGWSARPAQLDWFRELRDACEAAGVLYFHKQHGGRGCTKKQKRGGRWATLDGRLHHANPPMGSAH